MKKGGPALPRAALIWGLGSSGRADAVDELLDPGAEFPRVGLHGGGGGRHLVGLVAGVRHGAVDAFDVLRHLGRALGRFLDVTGDFLGGGALFLDGGGDGGGDLVDLVNDRRDLANGRDGAAGFALDAADLGADLFGRLGAFVGEALHF